jgi:hypothetical protein
VDLARAESTVTVQQLAAIAGLAVLDSVNPTAVIITLVLLTRKRTPTSDPVRTAHVYIATVMVTYAALAGVALTVVSTARGPLADVFESRSSYWFQLVVAATMLWWAAWYARRSPADTVDRAQRAFSTGAVVTAGVAVTSIEGLTALPMLTAVGLIGSADVRAGIAAALILGYSVLFVAPLLVLTGLHRRRWGGIDRFADRFDRLRTERRTTTRWLVGLVGVILAADALRVLTGS